MDLLTRVSIIAIILIAIFASALVIYKYAISSNSVLTAQGAGKIVLTDLQLSNPNATVSIINTTPSTLSQGSWDVFVSIVYNATSPCPTLYLDEYDYPATGLVPTVANLYTKGCIIYGLSQSALPYYTYVIASPEVAIAKSYNASFPAILHYVSAYGYQNTVVHATKHAALSGVPFTNMTFDDVWFINYTASGAPYSEYLIMNATGHILYNYTQSP
ncbi:MAG: hypothetical protein M1528_01260 [Candidatus Marsarchaeota archaeon]|jgi:hypothetical protein|nr:hypothetical protein [Candidatus Marsarchaeota archaeon]MCL5115146.1 hypothetical protein [Candidatus Marsarchaeota archaeon]